MLLLTAAGIASIVGCGGGGGGSVSGTGRAAVLLTDGFREDFGHVWATIYHFELTPQTGAPVVLFDDPTGRQIDLKTLRDSTGARFSFLGAGSIPAGTYTGFSITIGSTMQLFRNGVAVGNPIPVDPSIPTDSNGHPVLTKTFATPKTVGSTPLTIVVDFNLAKFVLRNSHVLPAIDEGSETGVDNPERHEGDEFHGTISNLTGTAPTLTFTLTRGNGMTVTVVTTASTSVFGSANFANGSVVEVEGTFDTTTQNLVATQVEVEGNGTPGGEHEGSHAPKAFGAVTNIDATAGTFTVTIKKARGFTPSQTTVNVVTNTSTVFRIDGGGSVNQAAFFTALAATPNAEVVGTYDAGTNTITATFAKIHDNSKDGGWEHDNHGFRDGGDGHDWDHGTLGHH